MFFRQLRFFVQDVQRSIGSIPECLAQMIKESTDYVVKSFEKRNADLKMELLKDLNDALGRVYDMFSRIFSNKGSTILVYQTLRNNYFISSNAQNGEKMPFLTRRVFFLFQLGNIGKKIVDLYLEDS